MAENKHALKEYNPMTFTVTIEYCPFIMAFFFEAVAEEKGGG